MGQRSAVRSISSLLRLSCLLVALLFSLSFSTASARHDRTACVDFEELALGATYLVGDSFTSGGATLDVKPFQWSDGRWTSSGYARVANGGMAGASGHELLVNNVNIFFDFGHPLSALSLHFGEYGGNLNIRINGDFVNFQNFADIDGATIGGVQVSVINGFGNDQGILSLSGTIKEFAVGGQELWIDHICPGTECVEFEDQPLGSTYYVGDSFISSGAKLSLEPFQWSNGNWTSGGYAHIENGGFAGWVGQESMVNNINMRVDFGRKVPGLSLRFGEYGGNLNIRVNGDFVNFQNFADIDGATIGGVQVSVINGFGNDQGILSLTGSIAEFVIGGQELWIDHICPADCVHFEDQLLGSTYYVGDSFVSAGVKMWVEPFQWSNGSWTSGGYARIDHSGMAGGSGQDLQINNANVFFDFGRKLPGLSLHFGEYGGNLNIQINGDFVNFQNFADIDGTTIGGVNVSVINGFGNDRGILILDGTIAEFGLGGQELWIDDVCPSSAEH